MTWKQLKKFVECHLEGLSRSERNHLTERNAHRVGFGAMKRGTKPMTGGSGPREKSGTHSVTVAVAEGKPTEQSSVKALKKLLPSLPVPQKKEEPRKEAFGQVKG